MRISDWSSDVCSSDLTFSANPLSAAACLAVVNFMRDQNVLDNVAARGKQLETGLHRLAQRYPWMADVRGRGLLLGFELVTDPQSRTPPDAALNANALFKATCFQIRRAPGRERGWQNVSMSGD